MHTVIYISGSPEGELYNKLKTNYEVNLVKSIKAAIIYQIEFPSIDAIIYDSKTVDHREILDSLDKIKLLNPMILQIVVGDLILDSIKVKDGSIINENAESKIINSIDHHSKNRRSSNRADWPINAKYHNKGVYEKPLKGKILSISVGGCFIKTDFLDLGKAGDIVDVEIYFEDFNFLVEGEIVRVKRIADINSPQGFSIKFIKPSPQTTTFIEHIINNKILSMVFSDFSHLEGSIS